MNLNPTCRLKSHVATAALCLQQYNRVPPWLIAGLLILGGVNASGAEVGSPSTMVADFCEQSEDFDRGIAVSPFRGATSQFIVDGLLSHRDFRLALGITDEQFNLAKEYENVKQRTDPHNHRRGAISTFDVNSFGYSLFLNKLFAAGQQEQLAGLYIYFEGLMALRRDPVAQLVGLTEI